MKLSIVIPVRDGETRLRDVVETLRAVPFRLLGLEPEIIVVDDGSRDATARVIESLGSAIDQVRRHRDPCGPGAALRTGLQAARGDLIAVQECDLRYDPNELLALVRRLLDGTADAVVGRRVPADPRLAFEEAPVSWTLRAARAVMRLASGAAIHDLTCGQRVFRAWCVDADDLREDGPGVHVEMCVKIAQRGWVLRELSVHVEDAHVEEFADEAPQATDAASELSLLRAALRYGWTQREAPRTTEIAQRRAEFAGWRLAASV